MTKENIIKKKVPKYSEMLMQLYNNFDEQLPEKLTIDDVFEVCIEAWNLANNKEYLITNNLYEKELSNCNNRIIIEKMIDFKIEKFPKCNNVIIDYNLSNNILQIKTQTQENHFNNIIRQAIKITKAKSGNKKAKSDNN